MPGAVQEKLEAAAALRLVKLLLEHRPIRALVLLPADLPGERADGPSTWAPLTYMGDSAGVSGLSPAPTVKAMWEEDPRGEDYSLPALK